MVLVASDLPGTDSKVASDRAARERRASQVRWRFERVSPEAALRCLREHRALIERERRQAERAAVGGDHQARP